MSGSQLAHRLAPVVPGVPVLFMTGTLSLRKDDLGGAMGGHREALRAPGSRRGRASVTA
jgi:hypothetical protein